MSDMRLRTQAKLDPPGQAQYWTAEEMEALGEVLYEKDAEIARLRVELAGVKRSFSECTTSLITADREIARLRGELAAARWEPVEDGERVELHGSGAMGIPTPSALMATPNNGLRILMQKTDMNGTSGVWYQSRLNDEHAVCRLVPPAAGGEVQP